MIVNNPFANLEDLRNSRDGDIGKRGVEHRGYLLL